MSAWHFRTGIADYASANCVHASFAYAAEASKTGSLAAAAHEASKAASSAAAYNA